MCEALYAHSHEGRVRCPTTRNLIKHGFGKTQTINRYALRVIEEPSSMHTLVSRLFLCVGMYKEGKRVERALKVPSEKVLERCVGQILRSIKGIYMYRKNGGEKDLKHIPYLV